MTTKTPETGIRWPWCQVHQEAMTLTHAHVLHSGDEEAWMAMDKALEEGGQAVVNEVVAAVDLPPGSIIGQGTGAPRKIPWTRAAMEARYKMKTFIPSTSPKGGVTVNGVNYTWAVDEEVTVPEIIYQVYMESHRAEGKEWEGSGAQKLSNIGPLTPDRFVER